MGPWHVPTQRPRARRGPGREVALSRKSRGPPARGPVRGRHPRRPSALPVPARHVQRRLPAERAAPAAGKHSAAAAREPRATPADHHHELRRCARARVPWAPARSSTSSGTRQSHGDWWGKFVPSSRRTEPQRPVDLPERVRRALTRRAHGHSEAPRRESIAPTRDSTATSSRRTTTSSTCRAATSPTRSPWTLRERDERVAFPVPGLLDARLEPARRPKPHLGPHAAPVEVVGRAARGPAPERQRDREKAVVGSRRDRAVPDGPGRVP